MVGVMASETLFERTHVPSGELKIVGLDRGSLRR